MGTEKEMLLNNRLEAFAGPHQVRPQLQTGLFTLSFQFHLCIKHFADVDSEAQRIKCLHKGQAGGKQAL